LPGRAYAIGFVRSYADHLGLDASETVERFKREIAERGEERATVPLLERPHDERRLPQGWLVIALVLIGVLGFGVWRLAHSASAYFSPSAVPVPSRVQMRPIIPKSSAVPHAAASHSSAPNAPTKNVVKAAKNVTAPATGAQAPAAAVASASTAAPSPPQAASVATLAPQLQALPKGQAYGRRNSNARVMLTALQPVHVLVLGPAPAKMLFMDQTLQPGDTYRVPYLPGTTLTTTDPAALAVTLDGRLLGLAGNQGTTLTAQSLDPKDLRHRFNVGSQH
jgi:cytoskeleton protein RodZ